MTERGNGDPFDILCGIVIADELRTGLRPRGMTATADDWKLPADVRRDQRTVVGGSDAGAHLDMMCGAIYSTALLAHGVREFGVISMEEAVHQLSDVPAQLYGLSGRGRIADGYAADLVAFDADEVGYGPERMRAAFRARVAPLCRVQRDASRAGQRRRRRGERRHHRRHARHPTAFRARYLHGEALTSSVPLPQGRRRLSRVSRLRISGDHSGGVG